MAINTLWTCLGIAIVLVILLVLWRPLLKVIYTHNLGLWLRINEFFASPNPDEVNKKVAEWEAKMTQTRLIRTKMKRGIKGGE
jgi:hypothetical protein